MKKLFFLHLILILAFFLPKATDAAIQPESLTCEYIHNPLGIDTETPQFSWNFRLEERNQSQSAFELLVSDDLKSILNMRGTVWESGRRSGSNSLHVAYEGETLKPFTKYYWRVRVYDQDGKASKWSDVASFETAMLQPTDWQAEWIDDGSREFTREEDFYRDDRAPLFRSAFEVTKKIQSARLYISGLGYYEAYLNGDKVGEKVLDAGWTAYEKQVLYSVYDISPQLRKGNNTIGVMLGNGWFNLSPLRFWGKINIREALDTGRPSLKAQIRIVYTDGSVETVKTDDSWQTAPGPIVRNNIYLGEHYDARLEQEGWTEQLSSIGWTKAVITRGPSGKLSAQMQPAIKITAIVKPVKLTEPKPGVFIFDMGQNFAGVAKIHVKGKKGDKVVLRYGEDIHPDGSLNVMTSVVGQIKSAGMGGPGAPAIGWQEDSYILKGQGTETWSPRFTFHGFRYVEVTGWPGRPSLGDIEGLRLSADLQKDGEFECSNPLFNSLAKVIDWTFLSNVFSVQSDCPAREKFGYGGDIVATSDAYIYNYDMANFYKKTIQDFANDQRAEGGITETAPYVGIADKGQGNGTGPLGWQLAYPYLMQQLFDFYGDTSVIETGYASFKRQIEFLRTQTSDNLFYQDISDHEALDEKPEAFTASAFYYHHVKLIAKFAELLNKRADHVEYSALAEEIRKAVNQKFQMDQTGVYANGTQSAQLFSLYYGFPDESETPLVMKELEKAFASKDWHVSTGIFATKMMFDVLREHNRNDIAYRISNQNDYPGWGHMVNNGATTLWETWAYSDNTYSQNHPMFGSINEWFYRSLLGINSVQAGFKKIRIKPQPAGDLTWAKGSYHSIRGKIECGWRIDKGTFALNVTIPPNTTAEVWLPTNNSNSIKEGNRPLIASDTIKYLETKDNHILYEIGSGNYSFTCSL